MSDYLVQFNNISKFFGKVIALKDVTMKLRKGEIMCLLGDNGAGKSTFLKTILGLIQATSGEGTVLGHDIRTEGAAIRTRIGYMPEYDALNPDMNSLP